MAARGSSARGSGRQERSRAVAPSDDRRTQSRAGSSGASSRRGTSGAASRRELLQAAPGGSGEATDRDPQRDTFLGSARALLVCAREFDRLADDVAKRAVALEDAESGTKAEVRRSPGRCIVQFGPVALTLSWVRARSDTALDGRLLIVEWQGVVGQRSDHVPERMTAAAAKTPAVALREAVLAADASSEQDWRWRRENAASGGYESRELAAICIESLLTSWKEQRPTLS